MFGRIGITQLLVIFCIFIVLFGYKKLPELGKGLGKGLFEMRKAIQGGSLEQESPNYKDNKR